MLTIQDNVVANVNAVFQATIADILGMIAGGGQVLFTVEDAPADNRRKLKLDLTQTSLAAVPRPIMCNIPRITVPNAVVHAVAWKLASPRNGDPLQWVRCEFAHFLNIYLLDRVAADVAAATPSLVDILAAFEADDCQIAMSQKADTSAAERLRVNGPDIDHGRVISRVPQTIFLST